TQDVDRSEDIVRAECNVLDALAVVLAQILLDLRLVVLRLVDRNSNVAARARHGATELAGLLSFDVEVANLAKVEHLLVEARPLVHIAARYVVRQMIDTSESGYPRRGRRPNRQEVDIVDRAVDVPIDQIDEAAADAFDRRDIELH